MATHIVGGDLTYKCVGDERYEFTLTVRRDCDFGDPAAQFDNPASIGFYDSDGNLDLSVGIAGHVLIPFMQDDTLDNQIMSECGFVGAEICVHEAVYSKIVRLPFKPGGYTAAYQRCCRNGSINNIINPLETGSTYFVEMTEAALQVCNSSPVFTQWPDIFICANEELDFSHAAVDPDGDVLVYSLCNPYDGASFALPKPQPPNGPDYDFVSFMAPFNSMDPMGGVPLTIDAATGQLSAIPNLIGQYLVGICVEEYRDGVLLSRVIRDFQYNVRVCSDPLTASFDVDQIICGTTEVDFENTTVGADSYIWNFDFPSTDPAFSSNLENPSFTYPTIGTYIVQLEAIRDADGCSQTFLDTIEITDSVIDAEFNAQFFSCDNDTYMLELEDLTTVTMGMSNIQSIEWVIIQGSQTFNESGQNVQLTLPSGDDVTVILEVMLMNGCVAQLSETFSLENSGTPPNIIVTIDSCNGDEITYNLFAENIDPATTSVSWDITENGNTTSLQGNPIMVTTNADQIAGTINITSNNCMQSFPFTEASLPDNPITPPNLVSTLESCDGQNMTYNLFIDNLDPNASDITWNIDIGTILTGNPVMYTTTASSISGSISISINNCSESFSFTENVENITPSATIEHEVTDCDGIGQLAVNLNALISGTTQNISSVVWTINNGTTTTLNGNPQSTIINPALGGEILLEVLLENQCVLLDTLDIEDMNPFDIDVIEQVTLCKGDVFELNIEENPGSSILWTDNILLQNGLDQFMQVLEVPADFTGGTQIVQFTITDANGCTSLFSIQVLIDTHIALSATHTEIDCDTYFACFENTSDIITPVMWTFRDDDGNVLGTSTDIMPCFTFPGIGEYHIEISGTSETCPGIPFVYCVTFNDPTIEIENHQEVIETCIGDEITLLAQTSLQNDSIIWCDITNGTQLEIGQGPELTIIPVDGQIVVAKISEIRGCVELSQTVTFDVFNIDMDMDLGGEITACREDLFDLNLFTGSTFTFSWETDDLIIAGNDTPTPTINIPANLPNGSYELNFQVSDGTCSLNSSITVNVTDNPLLSFDFNIMDCDNFTVCFQNTSSTNFGVAWDFGDPNSTTDISTDTNPCYTYGQEGTFNISLMVQGGACSGSSIVTPISIVNPSVEILNLDINGNLVFCSPAPVTVMASANTTGTITWFDISGTVLGTGNSIMIDPSDGLEIFASITSEDGCTSDLADASATFSDGSLDLDLFQPISLCRGDSLDLVVLTNQNVNFEWTPNPIIIDGLDTASPTVIIPADAPLGPIILEFTASNDLGCSDSFTYEIIVIDNEPLSFTAEVMDCENFTVCFTNTSPMSGILIWDFGDPTTTTDISPENDPCYTYPGPGTYDVVLNTITGNCTGIPDTMAITLNAVPDIEILDLTDTVTVCNSNVLSVSASSSLAGATIQWCDNNGTVIGTGPTIDITPEDGLSIVAKVIDGNNCSFASDPVLFSMGDLELDFISPLDVCEGDTITLDIQPQDGINFVWNESPFIISGGLSGNPEIYIDPALDLDMATLGFIATNSLGCGGQFVYELNILQNPDASFDMSVMDCEDYIVCFQNTSDNADGGVWDFGDLSSDTDISSEIAPCYTYPGPGEYVVRLELNNLQCPATPATDTLVLNELPFVEMDTTIMDQIACLGDTINLLASSSINQTINWCLTDGTPIGTGNDIDVIVDMDLDIIAKITDTNGCADTTDVLSIDLYEFDLTVSDVAVFCNTDTMQLEVINNNPMANLTYEWLPADCIISGGDTPTPVISAAQSKDVTALITDIDTGCTTEIIVPLTQVTLDVSITEEQEIIQGESTTIEVIGTNPSDMIEWSTGETETEITVMPSETTVYSVTVTNANGCSVTLTTTVIVVIPRCDDSAVFIPSAFSPNGDGVNDMLFVRSLFVESMELIIYNRWGEEIFETTNQIVGWDGTHNGEQLAPDSYAYCIRATCINGEENIRTGNVTIVR